MDIFLPLEWISFGCSWFLLRQANDPKARLLIAILAVTVAAESSGFFFRTVLHRTNHSIYNTSVPVIVILFLLLLRGKLTRRTGQRLVMWLLCSFPLLCIINLACIQGTGRFATYNYIAGTLALVVATVLYFLELIKTQEYVFLSDEPVFWIAAAILLLYVPKAVLYAVFEYLAYTNNISRVFGNTFRLLNSILSVIFFSLLAYASICRLIYRK